MIGTSNVQQLQKLVSSVEAAGMISGILGNLSLSVGHVVIAAQTLTQSVGGGSAPLVTAGQVALVQSAVNQSNAAAAATPSAASGEPTTANTAATTITNMAKGLTEISSTPNNVKQFEAGASAQLHWWGWTLKLNESATKALEALLNTDIGGLMAIGTALAAVSAPLAALAAIVSAVSAGLGDWLSAEDSASKGVVIHGYLWIGVWIESAK